MFALKIHTSRHILINFIHSSHSSYHSDSVLHLLKFFSFQIEIKIPYNKGYIINIFLVLGIILSLKYESYDIQKEFNLLCYKPNL